MIDYLQTHNIIPALKKVGFLKIIKMSQQRESREAGVVQVFRLKPNANPTKMRKNSLPLMFLTITKKGTEPIYIKYDDLKKDFPNLLFDYFEKNINIGPIRLDEDACLTPEKRDKNEKEKEKEATRDKEDMSARDQRERDLCERERLMKEREERERQMLRVIKEKEARPVRSCRFGRHSYKHRDDFDFDQEPPQPQPQPQPQPLPQPHSPSESPEQSIPQSSDDSDDDQEFKQKSFNKILDYDQMIEDAGWLNLISPAVIPATKVKVINPGSCFPPLLPLKEEREFSSEGFKDSEESEFLLDDRAMKDRKKRERILREQERMLRKKKCKKIKKKKSVISRK